MSVLSIVIPAYNEERGIGSIIERVLSIRPRLVEAGIHDMELIVVDDGPGTGQLTAPLSILT